MVIFKDTFYIQWSFLKIKKVKIGPGCVTVCGGNEKDHKILNS